MARPKKEITKSERLEIRLTKDQMNDLNECAKEMNTTRSNIIEIGLNLVKNMIFDQSKK